MGYISPHDYGSRRRPWAVVAAQAARQHNVVTITQLIAAGLTEGQVGRAVRAGLLHPIHIGVYAVGAPTGSDRMRWMAAVLATAGVLCGRSAAALWRIWDNLRIEEHVIVARSARWRHDGLRPHRPRRFDRDRDATVHDGITVTTPARTLLDLAAGLAPRQLQEAMEGARVQRGLVTDDALRDVLARHPTHRGARRLGAALTGPHTKSRLERRFLQLVRDHDLPQPAVNAVVAGHEVDILFGRVAVELDGRQHAGAWEKDARRDEALLAHGLTVLRLTWWDVSRDAARTAARVRAALGRHSPR